jgi:hypothetical protein
MTRRSKREVESWLDEYDLATEGADTSFNVREGVSEPFVTFEEPNDDGDDLPPGCEVAEVVEGETATYRVVRETDDAAGEPA